MEPRPPRRRRLQLRSIGLGGLTQSVRRALPLLLIAAGLAPLGCRNQKLSPNVVLVSIDCLNQRQLERSLELGMPNLRDLAQDSIVFSRAYAHAPWTTPSHMSMLTGLYPSQHGRDIPYGLLIRFRSGDDRIPLYQTLPERLRSVGYEAVGFVGAGSISAAFGLGQGFSVYNEAGRNNEEQSDLPETLSRVRAWIDTRQKGPFFLFVHTYELHYPLAQGRTPFRRAIEYLDGRLGELFSMLRDRGLYDSSLIILTGDHGSHMSHTEGKCCVHGAGHYEENLRVPFVLKLPSPGAAGRRDLLVRHIDILPTVLDVVGLSTEPYAGPGSSILKRLADGELAEEVYSYSEADGRCRSRRAIVGTRYKYVYTPDRPADRLLTESPYFFDDLCATKAACTDVTPEELYDLSADPFEEENLLLGSLSREEALTLDRLRERLTEHLNLAPHYRHRLVVGGPSADALDDATREALRALGYLQ